MRSLSFPKGINLKSTDSVCVGLFLDSTHSTLHCLDYSRWKVTWFLQLFFPKMIWLSRTFIFPLKCYNQLVNLYTCRWMLTFIYLYTHIYLYIHIYLHTYIGIFTGIIWNQYGERGHQNNIGLPIHEHCIFHAFICIFFHFSQQRSVLGYRCIAWFFKIIPWYFLMLL